MTHFDDRGLPLSTPSEAAAERYRAGVLLMLSAWPGGGEELERAIAADPGFALAWAALARVRTIHARPAEAKAAIATAVDLVARHGTERERSHVAVLDAAIAGRTLQARDLTLAHADRWPRDVLILGMALGPFGLLAFSGMAGHNQALVDLCARHAGHFDADDWWFLTYHGWALAENGEAGRGRSMLERALAVRRENASGVHALAHAMHEIGAGEDIVTLVDGWLPGYGREGVLHGHLTWHAALVALERDDVPAALRLYEAHVRPTATLGMPINVVSDGASFLWRLGAYGHDVPATLWQELRAYAAGRYPEAVGHGFIDAHMAIIEASMSDREALERRARTLAEMAAAGTLAAGPVVPAIARAAQAFAEGAYGACARVLEPVAGDVSRIGGSGAQREMLEDMLLVAYMRGGEAGRARALLDRRLHRRPSPRDARWRGHLGG
ncbi:MAG: tetratricopeptide repeat protein [Candidatus Sericytochromatia bacterium]|nr:tetratricopeptide repeat protein [Candidatus Sericytochromatia bacterium]